MTKFYKIYWIIVSLFLVGLAVFLVFLNSWLKCYDESLAEKTDKEYSETTD